MNLRERIITVKDKLLNPEVKKKLTLEEFRDAVEKESGNISRCQANISYKKTRRNTFYLIDYKAFGSDKSYFYTEKHSPYVDGDRLHVYSSMDLRCAATANHRLKAIKSMGIQTEIIDPEGNVVDEEKLEQERKERGILPFEI